MSASERLLARDHFGVKLGLDNIRALVDALGQPHRAYPTVLVAGTNGKGSVVAMMAAALHAAGHRVGRYTSPHLRHVSERIAVNGTPVSAAEFERLADDVLAAEARCRADGRLTVDATFFELITAAAFEAFRRAAVDVAVLEVGLGGRYDATNIAPASLAVITTIDFDHTEHLGNTLEAIAFQKAGIVKPGAPVVSGRLPADACAVVDGVAAAAGSPHVHAFAGTSVEREDHAGVATIRVVTPVGCYGPVRLGLRGLHQVDNALVAIRALEALHATTIAVPPDAVVGGLRDVEWPGRLQWLKRLGADVLIDAAHNPAGARALAAYLAAAIPERAPVVFAAMRDKDAEAMLAALLPAATSMIVTAPDVSRAMPPAELAALVTRMKPDVPLVAVRRSGEALDIAVAMAPRVVVCGSMYLIGELLPLLESTAPPEPA